MDEQEQGVGQSGQVSEAVQASEGIDLEALIAVVEARIVENLALMIERMAAKGS